MKWILKPDTDYPDLFRFSKNSLRLLLDVQYLSRRLAFHKLPDYFLRAQFKRVFNFGSRSCDIEYPIDYEVMELEDLLLPSNEMIYLDQQQSLTEGLNQMSIEPAPLSKQESDSHDLALALEVLEHLVDPLKELQKIHGRLKAKGYLLITTPFLAREHQAPIDHTRWTEAGLRVLVEKAGFKIIQSQKRGGFLSVCSSFTNYYWYRHLLTPYLVLCLVFLPLFIVVYFLGLMSLFLTPKKQSTIYLGVTLLAQKD